MHYRIHMIFEDGTEDFVDIKSDSIEKLQEQANSHVECRKPVHYWSEEIK